MSMRKILRRMAKAEMKRQGVEHINYYMSHGRWRIAVKAYPVDRATGGRMMRGYVGRKDDKTPEHRYNRGKRLFTYDMKFGDTPPRRHFNKETGKYYYGRKALGKVVNAEVF